jgi:phosphoribosylaminoimidazole-succinocarboxamide synthase
MHKRRKEMNELQTIIKDQMQYVINDTDYKIGKKYKGKVRDVYDLGDKLLIVTTDRISAFDRVLGTVPFKGEILNNLSLFWFEKTRDIIPNHILRQIHPNAVLVKKCKILPIEVIVRGYLTGSGWRDYRNTGMISGISLPKNLKKDAKFDKPLLTPSTKADIGHDLPISVEEIIKKNMVPEDLMRKVEDRAIKLFLRGQEIASKNNLILVDTKYEFGLLPDGELMIADEMHTCDSSRYWYLDTYEELFKSDREQRMLDKEYLRKWLMDNNFKGDGAIPKIPFEIISGVVTRYISAYETITGITYDVENRNSISSLNEAVSNLKE